MRHLATPAFWNAYAQLPNDVRALADKNFALLKSDPAHRSLQLKKVRRYHSARVGLNYRALAVADDKGLVWFWIGSHADYDRLLRAR